MAHHLDYISYNLDYYNQDNKHEMPHLIKKICIDNNITIGVYIISSTCYLQDIIPDRANRISSLERITSLVNEYLQYTDIGSYSYTINEDFRHIDVNNVDENGGNSNIIKLYPLLNTQIEEYFSPMSMDYIDGNIKIHPGAARLSILPFYNHPIKLTLMVNHATVPKKYIKKIRDNSYDYIEINSDTDTDELFHILNLHKLKSNLIQLKVMDTYTIEISEHHSMVPGFLESSKCYSVQITNDKIRVNKDIIFKKDEKTGYWIPIIREKECREEMGAQCCPHCGEEL